ncbi:MULTISPECIES: CU044_2847 family protein [Streptomyces]|uniref:CU044_2847 family protein n=1 Tax=Streptomyces TaxID=1883 RepID=UPI000A3B7AF8|nr:CU044_2847 family protein [Streptomyces rochei]WDI19636.1 CU044_2847 family protein [Streptomyces enissocaesilis]WMI58198.1 CU044_2847 family protein [Streptomyces rochei]
MTAFTSIRLDDGSLLRVETSDPAPAPAAVPVPVPEDPYEDEYEDEYEPIRRRRPADGVSGAADTLRGAVDRVRPAVSDIVDSLRSMPRRPDRITLEFGVKVTAEAGVVVARSTAEAHFTVGVEWETASDSGTAVSGTTATGTPASAAPASGATDSGAPDAGTPDAG